MFWVNCMPNYQKNFILSFYLFLAYGNFNFILVFNNKII
jgi:hypothetical protein